MGWIGLAVLLLVVVVVIGTIIAAIFLDWELGVSLLLIGIIVIPATVIAGYYLYRLFPLEQQIYLGIPNFIKCPYCGMNNSTIDEFCARCGKALPRKRDDDTQ